ncbi:MAG: methyltransferase domain-containing protein [Caulobacteraceae bacterium]|nr:methyltransferase domain-containing protein [Caulobacteraceae bacterium]
MTSLYDEVIYPNTPRPQTHPLRLSALASLHGAPSATFETCRVLEVGCGDGGNLIPMAVTAPNARFVGIDLAARPIAHGQQVIKDLGLTNIRLEARDLCAPDLDLGTFDYLIAHGVYAWTPEPAREALMALAGRALSPEGLAFISYNALPGCRLRQIVRDLLLAEPQIRQGSWTERVVAARAFLERFIALWAADADPFRQAVAEEAKLILKKPDAVIFHDELGEIYEPQYLADVAAAGARAGLGYLCDIQPIPNHAAVSEGLRALSGDDGLRFEQLEDFTILRRFHQSVFQKAEAPRAAGGRDLASLSRLWASAQLRKARPDELEGAGGGFVTPEGHVLETADPALRGLLGALVGAWPAATPLAPHLTAPGIAATVLDMFDNRLLTLQAGPSPFSLTPGERPLASPYARWQAGQGTAELSALTHDTVHIPDPSTLRFLTLLDGAHDRHRIAMAMAGMATPEILAEVEKGLASLARAGFLLG